jgi:NitT/TauT family transport system substrate-binding protein
MKTRLLLAIVVLGLATIAAACAPSPTPAPTPAPPTVAPVATTASATTAPTTVPPTATVVRTPTANPALVRLIGSGAVDFSSLDVVYWQQLLKDRGMNIDFKFVDAPDTAARSIIAGSADAYVGSLPSAILAVKNANANIRIIAVNNQASDYVLLSQTNINSIQDLKGHTIGIATPGSAGDVIIRTALKLKGVDPSTAQFVTIGGTSARVTAVLAGQVDSAPVHAADAAPAVATGKVKVLFNTGDTIGLYLQSGLIASGDWLKKNPDQAQMVVDAFVDSSRWAATNKDGYIASSKVQFPKMADSDRSSAYDLYAQGKFFPVNGGLGQAGIDAFLKLEQDLGELPKDLPPQSQWIDDSFVKKYVATHPVMQGN